MDSGNKYIYPCGNAFKSISKYSVGCYKNAREHDFDFSIKKNIDNNLIFIKTEYVDGFFRYINLDFNYSIITHNSDITIDERYLKFIERPEIINWYGQNINIAHPKVKSVPIGLANPKWPHGNQEKLTETRLQNVKKDKSVYVNFDIYTNLPERTRCLEEAGLSLGEKVSFEEYLKEIARSYFAVSPNGNGIDCHKHWESLLLKTIPIVTKSINIDFYKDLPFLILDNWSDLKDLKLNEELYNNIWNDFNEDALLFDNLIKNIIK